LTQIRHKPAKVKLDFLRTEQAWELLNRYCLALGLPEPGPTLQDHVARLETLTPGDFAVVARHHRFDPVTSADQFVASLERECAVKELGRRGRIGFV
jgi:hypothetical protein